MEYNRRKFLKNMAGGLAGYGMISATPFIFTACSGKSEKTNSSALEQDTTAVNAASNLFFNISLAQWSLHKTLFSGEMTNLEFPSVAKNEFGINAVEYVNQFFKDKARDQAYLSDLKKRADDLGVRNVLIMIDGEGNLGDPNQSSRMQAVDNHHKWIEAAQFLGCHSIRVNAAGEGTAEEVKAAAVDGLGKLSEYGSQYDINVIVENHGGYSSNGDWLSDVIAQVNKPNCGTLPDFGNFCIKSSSEGCVEEYDRYKGMKQLMPYAKGVSAKSHEFNEQGYEIHTDYKKMLTIVKDAGFNGYIGIEYEGSTLGEKEGIMTTKKLLEKVGKEIS